MIGTKLINFVSTVITFRLIYMFNQTWLFETMSYRKIMKILDKAKKVNTGDGDWELLKINPLRIEILQKLGLLPKPEEKLKRKRGRPRKRPLYAN